MTFEDAVETIAARCICPCCMETKKCDPDCTYKDDAPDQETEMRTMRSVHAALASQETVAEGVVLGFNLDWPSNFSDTCILSMTIQGINNGSKPFPIVGQRVRVVREEKP